MKRFISAITAVIFICLCFSSCGKQNLLEPVSGEIIKNEENYIVKFVVANKTGGKIESLSAVITICSGKNTVAEEKEIEYPLAVENGKNATISTTTEKDCTSAKITSYSYKTEKGKTVQGEFEKDCIAYIKSKTSQVKTRDQVAEDMIREIKSQFLEEGFMATGSYNSEKKQLVIVSKYTESYDVCVELYEREPDMWESLEDGIVSMSQACYNEFADNGFEDITANVGVVSSDEELLFSATNGTLVTTPGSDFIATPES